MSIFELLGSKRIQKIDAVVFPGLIDSRENIIQNGTFATGDFTGWYNSLGACSINRDPAKVWLGKYSAKLPCSSGVYILQDLPPLYGDELAFIFRAISDDGNPHLYFTLHYSDATSESDNFATSKSNWAIGVWEPATHKTVAFIEIGNQTAGPNSVFLAAVVGVRKNKPTISQSTKHDAATYKRAHVSLAVDGNIVAGVAGKVIKIHAIWGQATASVEGDFKDASGGNVIGHFKFNDREGFVLPPAAYPMAWFVSAVAGAFYCDYSTAAQAYWTVIYTDADAS